MVNFTKRLLFEIFCNEMKSDYENLLQHIEAHILYKEKAVN